MSSTSSRDPTPTRSMLARLQQGGVVLVLGLLALAVYWAVQGHLAAAGWLAFVALTGHAWILGLEIVAAAWHNRGDPVEPASLRAALHAWWQESRIAPQVFAWRQPFRWREFPDSTGPGSPGAAPAVLIHGFVCNRGFWLPWMERMRELGLPYVSVNLEPVFGSIDDYVPHVECAVQAAEALGGGRPVLVCHSMGGLAARAWLAAQPGNRARVGTIVTIGSPHHGTALASWSPFDNGQQMQQGSAWLAELALAEHQQAGEHAYQNFVCWYANTDNIVFPASTATLPGADNRHVGGAAHVDLAFHPRVMTESLAMLASAGNSPSERAFS
jgi:triacylglycerol lipase